MASKSHVPKSTKSLYGGSQNLETVVLVKHCKCWMVKGECGMFGRRDWRYFSCHVGRGRSWLDLAGEGLVNGTRGRNISYCATTVGNANRDDRVL